MMRDAATVAAGITAPIEAVAAAADAADRSLSQSTRRTTSSTRRAASRSSSMATTLADQSAGGMNLDDIESIVTADKDRPFAPPTLDYDADAAEIDQQRLAASAESAFGGWHWAPLVIALAPPIGTLLGGHADAWSDAILLLLGTFWLYQWMRVPWDMYALSRTRRILHADEADEADEADDTLSDEDRQARQRARLYSLTELQRTEYLALLACILSPFVGAYFLTWAQENLTDGHKYLNAFNIRLFTLAAGIRPWMHGVSLLRRRLILLQEDVHYPNSRVEALKRKTKRLESDLSTLRKLVATKSDVTILREGIDLPLSQLSRAVRRNEKKEENLRLTAEDKFAFVEARLDDLLREVAINTELIDEERRERERIAQMPLVHIVQAVKLLVGSRSSYNNNNNGRARQAIGPGSRPVAQIQSASSNGHSRHHHQAQSPQQTLHSLTAPPGSYSQSRAYLQSQHGYQSDAPSNYHGGPISPPSSVRSPANEKYETAWYAKGAMYYMFFPLNLSNAALSYAQSKVSSLLEDASPGHGGSPISSSTYPGSPTYGPVPVQQHAYHGHHGPAQQGNGGAGGNQYSGLSSSGSKTRLGKKKAVKI